VPPHPLHLLAPHASWLTPIGGVAPPPLRVSPRKAWTFNATSAKGESPGRLLRRLAAQFQLIWWASTSTTSAPTTSPPHAPTRARCLRCHGEGHQVRKRPRSSYTAGSLECHPRKPQVVILNPRQGNVVLAQQANRSSEKASSSRTNPDGSPVPTPEGSPSPHISPSSQLVPLALAGAPSGQPRFEMRVRPHM
jgi:hypothetical protein